MRGRETNAESVRVTPEMIASGVAVYEVWEDRQTLLAPDLGGAPIDQIETLVEAIYRACAQEASSGHAVSGRRPSEDVLHPPPLSDDHSDSRKMALAQNALARKLVVFVV
jgi:hypothetical protein